MKPVPLITLLTDFGMEDPFVGIMKGVILSLNISVNIIDMCHNINPHDVVQGAYQWEAAYSYFPEGTVQVGVVDPGVGGERKGILAISERYYYIAPDNGLLTLVERDDPFLSVFELRNPSFRLAKVSSTFHGRDIFAPAAGHLSCGVSAEDFGPPLDEINRLDLPRSHYKDNTLIGQIVAVDRFGNLLTNVGGHEFKNRLGRGRFELAVKGKIISRFREYYAESPDSEPFVLINSTEHLEIAVTNARADGALDAEAGTPVTIQFNSQPEILCVKC